jgi:hypothetical protein
MSSDLTYISTIEASNYSRVEALQDIIIRTLARWNMLKNIQVPLVKKQTIGDWSVIYMLVTEQFHFEIHKNEGESAVFWVFMYAKGRYRPNGTSYNFFERVMDCLEVQIERPNQEFTKMEDCYEIAYPPLKLDFLDTPRPIVPTPLPVIGALAESVIYDEESGEASSEDEVEYDESLKDASSDDDEDIPLRDMTDTQIDDYIEDCGRDPRDEVDEWTMNYEGGPIVRYSYVNFANMCLSDKCVSDLVIRNATFIDAKLENCVFDNVLFYDCVFRNVIIDRVTFRNATFINCYLHPNILESCSVENIVVENYEDDDDSC